MQVLGEYRPKLHYLVVKWELPSQGMIKCNTDRVSRGNPGNIAYGFCPRDDRGKLLYAQADAIGIKMNLQAEIKAVTEAVAYCKSCNMRGVTVEIDSLVVMKMIKREWHKEWHILGLKIPLVHLWKKSIREEEERRQGQVRTATKSVTKSIPQNTRGEDEDFVGGLSKWWKPGISSNKSAEKKRKKKKEEGKVHRRASNGRRLHRRNDANKDQTAIEEGRIGENNMRRVRRFFWGSPFWKPLVLFL